jgi:signal transduction histidine kinase
MSAIRNVTIRALAPLTRATTYRRAVHLLLGAVILLPYVLLGGVLARMVADDRANLILAAVAAAIAAVPPFLGGTRELEIAAARALLGVDLPAQDTTRPPVMETRLRAALWFAVHLAVGGVIATALLVAVPLGLIALSERLGLTRGALAGLDVGPLGAAGLWSWTLAGIALLVGTVYATAGLGALAATMAPALLGPSPAERLAAIDARERALAERNRLARELHDSVGHALTAATLQAGAARRVFDSDPEFARRALGAIEDLGRTAMDDLDHVLGVLRDAGQRDRRPTLDDLGRLCAEVRAGGTDLRAEIGAADVPAAVSREAYRLVQEGLTNATRHGGDGPVTLRVMIEDEVLIEVTNTLGGTTRPGGGRGVAGMRERVRLLGGRIDVGPDGGSWRMTARLPRDGTP